ncbi:MAG: heparan-alpha-glucosaminide N-acetyltransferase domain-containing protein [Pyrinomonadaceae bacterium]|nr:heparan-alpha-glucosaminide N-acetyltransferase domain-containing protein [Pyrinomonadaceae bacterium]MCX7639054.1 heparan-alpha-glucosaminide N-acetyltransferase domain-containing protein [Pyrinomonadaceae bacterium]MDW8303725.1 heparan-alpha-glucosaminide N-acetyltransferase domain-containing protein [Acidobacteriota bacterium]
MQNLERLISLDVFRGITIASMVLVNNPGTWSAVYEPLKHAEWHGVTPTDYIFPFFLFIVGVAITLSLGKKIEAVGVSRKIYLKIFKRAALIFLLGLFLAAYPFYDFAQGGWIDLSKLRIMGVLQRIAVCYLIASLIFIHTNWQWQALIAAALCLIYWFLMTFIPVPGCVETSIDDKACNLAAYLDRLILGENHLWRQSRVYDPEGLLSTIPAISTTLAGVLTGHWIRKKEIGNYEKVAGIFFFGVLLSAIGYFWGFFFPLNKSLWTSSYAVYTAGLALCFLGFCYYLVEVKSSVWWTKPFVIFGVNPLILFVGSGLMAKTLLLIKVEGADGKPVSLQKWIFDNFFLPFAEPINASLLYAVSFIVFWLFLMWLLYRKGIYIKV